MAADQVFGFARGLIQRFKHVDEEKINFVQNPSFEGGPEDPYDSESIQMKGLQPSQLNGAVPAPENDFSMDTPLEEITTDVLPSQKARISAWQAGWNVTNAIQGMFLVSFPYSVLHGGYCALASIVMAAFVTCYTGKVLIRCLYEIDENGVKMRVRNSYKQIAEAAWGPRFGGKIVESAQLIELLMTCVLYVILSGELLKQAFTHVNIHLNSWTLISAALLIPCAFLRNYKAVSWLSFWCTVAHVIINIVILGYCLSQAKYWLWDKVPVKIQVDEYPVTLGIIVFSYTSQIFLPSLEGSLNDRSKFNCMMHWTHGLAALFKVLFAYVGFLTWGLNTQEVITNNLPNDIFRGIVNVFLVAKALLSYPLPYFAAVDLMQNTLFESESFTIIPSCYNDAGGFKIWALFLRALVVVGILLLSIFIPHFAILMGLVGNFTGTMLSFVWPCIFFLRLKWWELGRFEKAWNTLIISIGCVCGSTGIYYSSLALSNAMNGKQL